MLWCLGDDGALTVSKLTSLRQSFFPFLPSSPSYIHTLTHTHTHTHIHPMSLSALSTASTSATTSSPHRCTPHQTPFLLLGHCFTLLAHVFDSHSLRMRGFERCLARAVIHHRNVVQHVIPELKRSLLALFSSPPLPHPLALTPLGFCRYEHDAAKFLKFGRVLVEHRLKRSSDLNSPVAKRHSGMLLLLYAPLLPWHFLPLIPCWQCGWSCTPTCLWCADRRRRLWRNRRQQHCRTVPLLAGSLTLYTSLTAAIGCGW